MKKQSLLLISGALLAFASCTQEGATGGYTQEQVDSIVDARVTEQMMALQASNDSMINALAQIKADSILAAMKGGSGVTTKTTTTTTRNTTVKNPGGATKKNDPGSVTSRPAADDGTPKSVSDRPGADKKGETKSVSDRPGAN